MKRITALLQKLFLSALMSAGFFYALTNINVTCSGPSYQAEPPKALDAFKQHLSLIHI